MKIPQVDVSSICMRHSSEPDLMQFQEVGQQLNQAFTKCGFVYLSNHGIDEQLVEGMLKSSQAFFELEMSVKEEFAWNTHLTHGYVRPGQEMLDVLKEGEVAKATHEIREAFDVSSTEAGAPFPDSHVPNWRPVFQALSRDLKALTLRILKALAVSLGREPELFARCHRHMLDKGNGSILRSLYYPPIHGPIQPGTIRCGEHSDYGSITLLFQDDLGGLEVKGTDGQFIPATPVPKSILVNVGDMMEIMTNGQFPATIHRVAIPNEELIRQKARQSFVFFVHPDDETVLHPICNLEHPPDQPKCQPGTTAEEYLKHLFELTIVE